MLLRSPLFQFPPPRGGERGGSDRSGDLRQFQFPPPRGGEQLPAVKGTSSSRFQFPPPRGGEPKWNVCPETVPYFNSRPREGANRLHCLVHPKPGDFNSRPREGANVIPLSFWFSGANFNSRPREGANTKKGQQRFCAGISIPAPARGRTALIDPNHNGDGFQFPPPRGGEQKPPDWWGVSLNFNSRPREGANRSEGRSGWPRSYFNSRPREGANDFQLPAQAVQVISIPAPARGRTTYFGALILPETFQFPPPRGGEQQNCTK